MDRNELINCFRDTVEKTNSGLLKDRTDKARNSNKVYRENFIANQRFRTDKRVLIEVFAGTTLDIAKRYRGKGRIAVLNFANPVNPGGGVVSGAMAQEECLCRSSSLYPCLVDKNVYEDYYAYNNSLNSYFYSDRLIYTGDVTVFKDDSIVPQMLSQEEWFQVDVITCAAPYLPRCGYIDALGLKALFEKRIKNILEAACDNGANVLILGAFGCGAFKNPPEVVAAAFYDVIMNDRYDKIFSHIVFAIKPSNDECPNLAAFTKQFKVERELNSFEKKLLYVLGNRYTIVQKYDKRDDTYIVQDKESNCRYSVTVWHELTSMAVWNGEHYIRDISNYLNSNYVEHLKLIDHPGIFRIIDVFRSDSLIYILREEIDGMTVDAFVRKNGPVTLDMFFKWALQLADTINSVNNRKNNTNFYTYCNIIPSNIYITSDGNLKLLEIGVFYEDDSLDFLHLTRYALLPMGGFLEVEFDIYNLGITLGYMVTGNEFFGLEQIDNKWIHYVIKNCIGIDPNRRYQTCEELIQDLKVCEKSYDLKYKPKHLLKTNSQETTKKRTETPQNEDNKYFYPLKLTEYTKGETFEICKPNIWVGKERGFVDLCILSNKLLRLHARLSVEDERWFIEVDGLNNRTWLNSVRLSSGKKYQIKPNDIINFANVTSFVVGISDIKIHSSEKSGKKYLFVPSDNSVVASESIHAFIKSQVESVHEKYENNTMSIYKIGDTECEISFSVKVWNKHCYGYDFKNYTDEDNICRIKSIDHPGIYRVIDVIEFEKYVHIVHEKINGISLNSFIEKIGVVSPDVMIKWILQISDIIRYLNESEAYIHRFICPGNLYLNFEGNLKLFEIGILYDVEEIERIMHIDNYSPPEMYAGRFCMDVRSDIYSMGVLMYYLLTGKDLDSLYERVPLIGIDKGLEYVIRKCTMFDPEYRYQSCEEFIYDLQNYKELPDLKNKVKNLFKKKHKKGLFL